jgi:hypothetical protein
MGIRLAADFDLELFLSELEGRQRKRDELLREYLTRPHINVRDLFVAAAPPPAAQSRLVLDLGAPGGGLVWSLQQVNLSAQDPFTSGATGAATAVDASSANAAAANNVSLPAVVGQTNSVTGFEVTGAGATAASVILITLTGVVGGPLNYQLAIPAGASVGVAPLIVEFPVPIPATGPNVAITLNVPSFGAGNTNAAAVIHGQLSGAASIQAAVFRGGIPAGIAFGSPLDMGQLVATGLTPPANYQAGGKSVGVHQGQHIYAVLSGNLSGFNQYFASAVVLEVPDTMEAVSWL